MNVHAARTALHLFSPAASVPTVIPSTLRWVQQLAATLAAPAPVSIKLRRAVKRLDVQFSDGKQFSFAAEFLRVKSPSADNQRTDARGLERVPAGRKHVDIMSIEPVGSYAIRLKFDDLHDTGIYTWSYLYDLGLHKLQYSRQYIKSLRARGLTREPARGAGKARGGPGPTVHHQPSVKGPGCGGGGGAGHAHRHGPGEVCESGQR